MDQPASLKRRADDTNNQESKSKKPRIHKEMENIENQPMSNKGPSGPASSNNAHLTESHLAALQHPEFTEYINRCLSGRKVYKKPTLVMSVCDAFVDLFEAQPALKKKFQVDPERLMEISELDLESFLNLLQKAVDSCSGDDWLSVFWWPGWRPQHQPSKSAIDRAIENAWTVGYCGERHHLLFKTLCEMIKAPVETHKEYINIATVFQSSGYGKSRMLLEHSSIVFTFPFNLRDPVETTYGYAYPLPDSAVRNFMLEKDNAKIDVSFRYFSFLATLFGSANTLLRERVECSGKKFSNSKALASWWRKYLQNGTQKNRFYGNVIKEAYSQLQSRKEIRFNTIAVEALKKLIRTLAELIEYPNDSPVKVVIYFDEAHELATNESTKPQKTSFDVLCSTLHAFNEDPIMALFMSTTNIIQPGGPKSLSYTAHSIESRTVGQAQITELPFDCHPSFPLNPSRYSLDDISDLRFLVRFGRPLFWTLVESGQWEWDVLTLAMVKLDPSRKTTRVPQTAAIDLSVLLEYEPSSKKAQMLQQNLVASHLRAAMSIPVHYPYIRSHYPSEPFLAEAASHLIGQWEYKNANIVINTVSDHYSEGLLDRSDAGELAARILLMSAYRKGCREQYPLEKYYSKGCTVQTFLRSLFTRAEEALVAKPDDITLGATTETNETNETNETTEPTESTPTLEEALGSAVVRFTHFVKCYDDTAMSWRAIHAAMLRGHAILCRNNQEYVDIIIPVLVRTKGKACQHVMTAILIHVKRRSRTGSSRLLVVDQADIHLFPENPELCTCCDKPLTGRLNPSNLPYISLVLDLGAQTNFPKVPTRSSLSDATFTSTPHAGVINVTDTGSPSDPYISKADANANANAHPSHPRYSIYVGGCSSKNYVGITYENHRKFGELIRCSHLPTLALADHPRQGPEQINAMLELMPSCAGGKSYNWLGDGYLTDSHNYSHSHSQDEETDAFEVGLGNVSLDAARNGP